MNYSFADRYLFAASPRYEGDSKFVGSDQEWGVFPAVSAAWRIKQESFMQNLSFIDDLKLRAGFGVTGIASSQYYQAYYRLGYTGNSRSFYYNERWINMLEPRGKRNPEFTREKGVIKLIYIIHCLISKRATSAIFLSYESLYCSKVSVV